MDSAHHLPDRRLPVGLMMMSRLEAGGPEELAELCVCEPGAVLSRP
jgi:hypothetical protein